MRKHNFFLASLVALLATLTAVAYANFSIVSVSKIFVQGGGPNMRAQNIFGSPTWVTPNLYYVPGTGNPAISTADYYHINGLYGLRPYDLLNSDCGTTGASIAAARGRYVWFASSDHGNFNSAFEWADGNGFYVGFSSDPGVLPATFSIALRTNNNLASSTGGQANFFLYQRPWLVCNPDDGANAFYVYGEGAASGIQHEEGLMKSNDLISFTVYGGTHLNANFNQWSSFQVVTRDSTNTWHSVGLKAFFNPNSFVNGKWTSTDGLSFTGVDGTSVNTCLPTFANANCPAGSTSGVTLGNAPDSVLVGGQAYTLSVNGAPTGGYVARLPIDANFNVLASPSIVNISAIYLDNFPGPAHLQDIGAYVESGVAHYYALHGFFPSSSTVGTVSGATYANGGGLWQENIDYYTEVVDATAAVDAAPIGVTASCAGGVSQLTWYNALPSNTYRVYRGTSAGTQATNLGAATAPTFNDTPGSVNQFFYKVVTLNAGVEKGNRIVNVYCTSANARVNAHINRVLNDGGDVTKIDQTWLAAVDAWLASTCNCLANLRLWTNPSFGVKLSGSNVVKVYDYGTTLLPRGGDLTFCTTPICSSAASTTYSATGLNSTTPAWVNGTGTSWSYYGSGRFNNIRRQIQVTTVAAFSSAGDARLLGSGQVTGAPQNISLGQLSGNVSFSLSDAITVYTAIKAVSGSTAKIISGTFDGSNVTAWSEGIAGTGTSGLPTNSDLALASALRGSTTDNAFNVPFLGSGSLRTNVTYSSAADTTYALNFLEGGASFTASDLIMFDLALSSAQMLSLAGPSGLLRTRIGP